MQISDALVPSKIYFMTLPVTRHRVLSERGFLAAAYRIPDAMAHQKGLAASCGTKKQQHARNASCANAVAQLILCLTPTSSLSLS